MTAIVATLKGRVLIQVGEAEPVEVGIIDIPIHVGTQTTPVKRSEPPTGPSGVSRRP